MKPHYPTLITAIIVTVVIVFLYHMTRTKAGNGALGRG